MVARIANKDPEEIVVPLARATVTRSFTTVWRILLRITSDAAIVQRTPAFYTRSRNVGKMSAQILSAGIAESIVSEFPGMPLRDIVALAASIETVLTLAGRVDVKSRGTRTPDGARFLTRWRVK